MHSQKIMAGAAFPNLPATNLDGESVDLSKPTGDADWHMVVVYRGQHCPLCTKYLNQLDGYLDQLAATGVSVVAVSK